MARKDKELREVTCRGKLYFNYAGVLVCNSCGRIPKNQNKSRDGTFCCKTIKIPVESDQPYQPTYATV